MLVAYMRSRATPRQIVIAGDRESPATAAMLRTVRERFLPERSLFLVDSEETRARLASAQPALAAIAPIDGKPAAYVCENFTCKLPVTEAARMAELLA
jgi:uncharacterized protein YyaL (SSP411 family)